MQLTVTGRHISVTNAVKVYIRDKLQHIIDKHLLTRITKAHIIMNVEKYRHVVEVELHGPQINIYGKAVSPDMYASVDKVMDKIERQLVKYKEKYDKRKRFKTRRSIRMPLEGGEI